MVPSMTVPIPLAAAKSLISEKRYRLHQKQRSGGLYFTSGIDSGSQPNSTQVTAAQRKLKTAEKELRELSRVVNQSAGEYDVIGKLAEFSSVLPNNVMVMNLRWTDSSVDLTMRSEAESLNVPEMLRPLKFWKMEQIQQRRRNNDVTSMIMLKLVPAEEKK